MWRQKRRSYFVGTQFIKAKMYVFCMEENIKNEAKLNMASYTYLIC
jgi:hypothetical protein